MTPKGAVRVNNGKLDNQVVSPDNEQLILVDIHDREIGSLTKADAHRGSGTLHRAFSLFVFNPAGELLVQQRANGKRLWPGYWSNSCCSHPRRGETMKSAIHRRLWEELGLRADLQFLFKFRYHAQYDRHGAEYELCSVYAGHTTEHPHPNSDEIAAWRYVAPQVLQTEITCAPESFTPWFKLEWAQISRAYPWLLDTTPPARPTTTWPGR